MKKFLPKFSPILAIFFCTFSAHATEIYKFDTNHTSINWSANHFGFSSPSGKFTDVDGTLTLDEASPQNSLVEIIIKTDSISTGNSKFDEHLKSPDFFYTEKFPTAKFVSTSVTPFGKTSAKVQGNLTLLGITKPVTLNVKVNKIGLNPINQKKTAGFSATTSIKRSQFGMEFGLPGISDEVKIAIESELTFALAGSNMSYKNNIAAATVDEWKIIPSKSKLEFRAIQENSSITGSFKKFDGKINFDKNQLTKSKIQIDIDTTSIDISFNEALETIKNAAWLSVQAFPKATFTATRFTNLSAQKTFRADGMLTIKGKTIATPVEFILEEYSQTNARAVGKTTIKRSAFLVGDRDPKKANGVKDEIEITFMINAER